MGKQREMEKFDRQSTNTENVLEGEEGRRQRRRSSEWPVSISFPIKIQYKFILLPCKLHFQTIITSWI